MLLYIFKSIIFLSAMYLPYMLMLRNESFFRFNRMILLCIMALSLVLPFFDIHALSWESNPMNSHLQGIIEVGAPSASYIQESADKVLTAKTAAVNWWNIAVILYLSGMLITTIIKIAQFITLHKKIHHGVLWSDTQNGITIYCHLHAIAPFSWMRSIVISEEDYMMNANTILRHEMGHIKNLHSLDILLLNLCQIIQWINPLAWIMTNSLRDVHEYEADDTVLRSGISIQQYQNLLIKKAVGSSSYAFANSFNHSLLKKRFTMMLNKKSNPWMRSKALYILPVAIIALSAFATPEFNNHAHAGIEVINSGKVTENSGSTKALAEKSVYAGEEEDDKVFIICEEMPEYVGGSAKMMEMLMKNMKYPAIAQEHGVQGKIIVGFIVEKDGSCSNFEIKRNSAAEKTEGATVNAYARPDSIVANAANIQKAKKALEEEAIRVCKLMKFTPGKQRGMAVRVQFSVPLTFRLQ